MAAGSRAAALLLPGARAANNNRGAAPRVSYRTPVVRTAFRGIDPSRQSELGVARDLSHERRHVDVHPETDDEPILELEQRATGEIDAVPCGG
jgi:hypothetical protein